MRFQRAVAEGNPVLTQALMGRPEEEVHRYADKIREAYGLPDEIMWAIFGDMAIVTDKMNSWPCNTFWKYGLTCTHGTPRSAGENKNKVTCLGRAMLSNVDAVAKKPKKVVVERSRDKKTVATIVQHKPVEEPVEVKIELPVPEPSMVVYDPDELIGEALPKRYESDLIG